MEMRERANFAFFPRHEKQNLYVKIDIGKERKNTTLQYKKQKQQQLKTTNIILQKS